MKSVITGISGFIGQYLKRELISRGDQVIGLTRSKANISSNEDVEIRELDLENLRQVKSTINEIKPDRIFHLSALNNVLESFREPGRTFSSNVNVTINLLEAVRDLQIGSCQLISIGSAAEYGAASDIKLSLAEDLPLLPRSPYGASKAAQGMMASIYSKAYGIPAIHVRPFAIIGPGKEKDVISDFCRGIVELERSGGTELLIGHLESERDFVDVRDFIHALILVAEKGESGGTYNICNNESHSLREVIEFLQTQSKVSFRTKIDSSRKRPTDDLKIVGSNSKLIKLGYSRNYSFQQTLIDTFAYWRERSPR